MQYPNSQVLLDLDFRSSNRVHPGIINIRSAGATGLQSNGYKHIAAYTPRLSIDPNNDECLGLRTDKSRSSIAGNTSQILGSNGYPQGSIYFLDNDSQSNSFIVLGQGYEDGITYTDYRLSTTFSRSYFDFYPFGIVPLIKRNSVFSLYFKVLSNNLPANSGMSLINRDQDGGIFNDSSNPMRLLSEFTGIRLKQGRVQAVKDAPSLSGSAQAISSAILLIHNVDKPGQIDFRIGYPLWEDGTNASLPYGSQPALPVTTVDDYCYMPDMQRFSQTQGTLYIEFICPNIENATQDVCILSDTNFMLGTIPLGVSVTNTGSVTARVAGTYHTTPAIPGQRYKVALSWGNGDSGISINGNYKTAAGNNTTQPVMLHLGATVLNAGGGGASIFTGTICAVRIFDKPSTQEQMRYLTA